MEIFFFFCIKSSFLVSIYAKLFQICQVRNDVVVAWAYRRTALYMSLLFFLCDCIFSGGLLVAASQDRVLLSQLSDNVNCKLEFELGEFFSKERVPVVDAKYQQQNECSACSSWPIPVNGTMYPNLSCQFSLWSVRQHHDHFCPVASINRTLVFISKDTGFSTSLLKGNRASPIFFGPFPLND